MAQALFYPSIDIANEAWLKTSVLYWDSLHTIVPVDIKHPYATRSGLALQEAGYLVPLWVHSDADEVTDMTDDVLAYFDTREGSAMLARGQERYDLLQNEGLIHLHREKMSRMLLSFLRPKALSLGSHWIGVDPIFGHYYMTLLAGRLAARIGASLVTSIVEADRLAEMQRLDVRAGGHTPSDGRSARRVQKAVQPRRLVPGQLARGMLAHLAIDQVASLEEVPVEDLIRFRQDHGYEIANFRKQVDRLTSSITADLPLEALKAHVADLYNTELQPAIQVLKAALSGLRTKWIADSLLRIAFVSVGVTTWLGAAGLDVPTAILAAAGVSLTLTGTMYNVEKRKILLENPSAYLLSLGRGVR